ncbi:MAG TPA: Hsp20/alpha crystallin family protein [Polyangiaceae bacterium]|nr:Hsp20/alpha crystallin family protein [Polyangiaceae bacterium]
MANITIRKQNGDKPIAATPTEQMWDPWRTMRSLLSWDPFREMAPFPAFEERAIAFSPAFDVKETKDAYLFKADVPGMQDKDLEVTMTGNRLTVSGKRDEEKEEKSERYYTYERNYGSFSRSFTLPEGADTENLVAKLDAGVLTITVPKKPEVQPKRIAVKTEGQSPRS